MRPLTVIFAAFYLFLLPLTSALGQGPSAPSSAGVYGGYGAASSPGGWGGYGAASSPPPPPPGLGYGADVGPDPGYDGYGYTFPDQTDSQNDDDTHRKMDDDGIKMEVSEGALSGTGLPAAPSTSGFPPSTLENTRPDCMISRSEHLQLLIKYEEVLQILKNNENDRSRFEKHIPANCEKAKRDYVYMVHGIYYKQ